MEYHDVSIIGVNDFFHYFCNKNSIINIWWGPKYVSGVWKLVLSSNEVVYVEEQKQLPRGVL